MKDDNGIVRVFLQAKKEEDRVPPPCQPDSQRAIPGYFSQVALVFSLVTTPIVYAALSSARTKNETQYQSGACTAGCLYRSYHHDEPSRHAERDRLEAHNDYVFNQEAEEESRTLLHHLAAQHRTLLQLS